MGVLSAGRPVVGRLRGEVLVAVAATAAISAAVLALAWSFPGVRDTPSERDWVAAAAYAHAALALAPIVAALAMATTLTAGDIEAGTYQFAWCIAASRRRWVASTLAVGLAVLALTSVPLVAAAWALADSLGPVLSATSGPALIDAAPVLIVVRAACVFAIGALVGLASGRQMPSMLAGLLVSCLVLGAVEIGFASLREAAAGVVDPQDPGTFLVVPWNGAAPGGGSAQRALGLTPQTRLLLLGGEVAVLVGIAAAAALGSVAVAERRRG